ncbi:uncharacterized protein LOC124350823 isoform X2 [Daphnia pulicaria]|uniref:uncharacterized protein LOC124350823 isoform X2 n=1 Tax=Daphnia pulicaria TaxID=35523 RepID=UPI001EE9B4EB|nr:uncharacterized protein LOC124350823 isoform X2 [Daphnia pulicaria]
MASHKRKVVYFFLLAATLSIIAVASANPVSLENAESLPNQDLKSQDEQHNEANNRSTRCLKSPCPRFGWGRWGFATPNESSADEERQKRDENNFWYRAGMRTKLFFKNRFRG